ncbi:ubiquitin-like domain-containing protein [Aquipuribacter sp. MA13-6]|uniref:ubiquitin-like domain-containing protein n=1 Tax=unclassified Aquipuribacter TaxID=2635084 RepID=UPI003EEA422B
MTRPTRLVAAAQAAVLTLLVAGVAGWTVLDRTVTLEVDGQAQQVRILGSEVSDVLAAADIEVGERDLVSPAIDEDVADGEQVTVRYARQLTVADPAGDERTFWTTELTVDDALVAAGLRHEDAWLSASRSASIGRSGLSLTLSMPKDVTVVAYGDTQQVTSPAPTVADLLDELGLALGASDRLAPAPETVLAAGQTVTVQRVSTDDLVETEVVESSTVTVEDAELFEGEDEVREEGSDGELTVTTRVVLVDGVEESRQEIARTVTTAPVDRVVAEGTKERPKPKPEPKPEPARESSSSSGGSSSSSSGSSSSGSSGGGSSSPAPAPSGGTASLNWSALAACESGGNPSIVSSNGLFHGLYQFDRRTWQSMGGSGVASQASASEQTARAQALYDSRGAQPWPHCGPRLFS